MNCQWLSITLVYLSLRLDSQPRETRNKNSENRETRIGKTTTGSRRQDREHWNSINERASSAWGCEEIVRRRSGRLSKVRGNFFEFSKSLIFYVSYNFSFKSTCVPRTVIFKVAFREKILIVFCESNRNFNSKNSIKAFIEILSNSLIERERERLRLL